MEEPSIQPITENLWWVIPGKLAGVRKPNPDEISDLQNTGIGAIVSADCQSTTADNFCLNRCYGELSESSDSLFLAMHRFFSDI